MLTTPDQWRDYCEQHITAGYTPGGNARATYDTGLVMARFLCERSIVHDYDRVLDVGCGNGRLAMGFQQLGLNISYMGLDVIRPSIDFCRSSFWGHKNYNFQYLDVYNPHYWPQGLTLPDRVVYPNRGNSIDVVIAFSLFSHTENVAIARRNLQEMRRVLDYGGIIFLTLSFTTVRSKVSTNAAHTIYHFDDVLELFKDIKFQFLPLGQFHTTNPNQVGVILDFKGT